MAIDTGFLIGYSGHAKITTTSSYADDNTESASTLFNLTSGSYTRQMIVPSANSFNTPLDDNGVHGPIAMGAGIYSYSGNISFELTESLLSDIWKADFFKRYSLFNLSMNDGNSTLVANNCCWSSISVNCGISQIPTGSISFQSNNGFTEDLSITSGVSSILTAAFDSNNSMQLVPYWQTGPDGITDDVITDLSITFDRSVTPIYLNNDLKVPSYLKAGLISVSASVTAANVPSLTKSGSITIYISSSKGVTLNYGFLSNNGYNITGISESGNKTYAFNSISQSSANDEIFTIL